MGNYTNYLETNLGPKVLEPNMDHQTDPREVGMQSAAQNVGQLASMGSKVGGPIGAGVGAALGLGVAGYKYLKQKKENHEEKGKAYQQYKSDLAAQRESAGETARMNTAATNADYYKTLYQNMQAGGSIDKPKIEVSIEDGDPYFRDPKEFEKFYADKAKAKLIENNLYNPNLEDEDNVVLRSTIPTWEEYINSPGRSRTVSGEKPGNNSEKIAHKPTYRKMARQAGSPVIMETGGEIELNPEVMQTFAIIESEKTRRKNEKIYRSGGSINVIPKGVTHEEKNKLGDKGIPIVSGKDKKKIAEIEKNELTMHKQASAKIEELTQLYHETKDPAVLKELGQYMKKELDDNTIDLQGELL